MTHDAPRAELRTSSLAAATAWLTQTPATSIWRGDVGTEDWLRVESVGAIEELGLPRGVAHRLGRAKAGMPEPPTIAHDGFVSSQAARLTHDGVRWWLSRRAECHERVLTMVGAVSLANGESAPVVHGDVLLIGKLRLTLVDRRYVVPLVPAGTVDPRTGLLSRMGFEQELAGLAAIGRRGVVVAIAFDRGGDPKRSALAALALHAAFPRLPVFAEPEVVAALSLDVAPVDALVAAATRVGAVHGARVVGTWNLSGDVTRVGHELELLLSAATTRPAGGVVSLRESPILGRIVSRADLAREPDDGKRRTVMFALGELAHLTALGPSVVPTLLDELVAVAASLAKGKTKVANMGEGVVAARVSPQELEAYAAEVQREWHSRPPLVDGRLELPRSLVTEVCHGELLAGAAELSRAARGHTSLLASLAGGLPYPIAGRVALAATASSAIERIKLLFDVLEGAWRMVALVLTAAYLSGPSSEPVSADLRAFLDANRTRHAYPLGLWRELARIVGRGLGDGDDALTELASALLRVDGARKDGLDALADQLHPLRNRFAHEVYPEARAKEDVADLERTTADLLRALRPLAAWTLITVERTEPDPFGEGQEVAYFDHTGPTAAGERRIVGLRSPVRLGNVVYLARVREGLMVPLEPYVRRLPGGHSYDLFWVPHLPEIGKETFDAVVRGEQQISDIDAKRISPRLRSLLARPLRRAKNWRDQAPT